MSIGRLIPFVIKEKIKSKLRNVVYFFWKFSSLFKRKPNLNKIKKILVIHPRMLGDLIVAVPMMKALYLKYGPIDIIMRPEMKEVLEGCPYINKMIFVEEDNPFKILNLIKNKYDAAIIVAPHNLKYKLLCKKANIPIIIGNSFSYSFSDAFLTFRAKDNPKEHFVLKDLKEAEFLGANLNEYPKLEFYLSKKAERKIEKFIRKNKIKKFVIFHVGKRGIKFKKYFWKNENWAEIADYAIGLGYNVIFTGTKLDSPLIVSIKKMIKSKKRIFSLCGKLSIKELGSLIKRADLLISLDTGPVHIGAALNKKMIVLNTEFPNLWHPWANKKNYILLNNPPLEEMIIQIYNFCG